MFKKTEFKPCPDGIRFADEEEKILKYWEEINAFKEQLKQTSNFKPYTFYDGPPFATGLPHYGNLLAGTIKDVVCRYASQTGHFVERRFGWDCHGLPVEYEIDKKLKIKDRKEVLEMGISKYNNECRSIVMKYSKEWRHIVNRFGRWIDFDHDYKTMNIDFMESVWYVFKQMWDKKLIYRGSRVMPYSNACSTVLSNFEVQQNYKEVEDPAIVITFPQVQHPEIKFLAWTTTPWTLPSNLMLAVNSDFVYVTLKEKSTKNIYIMAECRLAEMYSDESQYEVISKCQGKDLVGIEYVPLYDYFYDRKKDGCFRVCAADFVTSDTGTGIVHCAPGFGEDDFRICVQLKVIQPDNPPCPLDDNGKFTKEIKEYAGVYVKDADKVIIDSLKQRQRLIKVGKIKHNYPFCWRSDTPLIYKAVHSWFIKVTSLKEDLIKNNKKAYWVPTYAQEGRFNNWLEDAKDWCFSRSRFWGNPIPIWVSDDFEEQVCVGSVKELMELTGAKEIKDLHRDYIDQLTIPSKKGKGQLHRIDEVFDCWFESGSMPYGQQHYPFGMSEEEFSKRFPADFIGEGLDQTRGWFYTLNVVSTAIRNDTPYKNLIVNGIVLAHDGKKMSKSKKNYPDPLQLVSRQGADAIRLYMINSPLVRAEPLNFKEEGVQSVTKDIFLPWYNAYRFLIQNISRWEKENQTSFVFDENISENINNLTNLMDKWIIAATHNMIKQVRQEMALYKLYTVTSKLTDFIEQMTNWYVRLNRIRIKGDQGPEARKISLNVLFNILLKSLIVMAPFVPFITEMMYQNLKLVIDKKSKYYNQSVHFLQIPEVNEALLNESMETNVKRMQSIINLARTLREKKKINLKQPIQAITIVKNDKEWLTSLDILKQYIQEELNVAKVNFEIDQSKYFCKTLILNHKNIGKKLRKLYNNSFIKAASELTNEQVTEIEKAGKAVINGGEILINEDFTVGEKYRTEIIHDYEEFGADKEFCVILDCRQDENLKLKGLSREFLNRIQKTKKKCGIHIDDKIIIFYNVDEKSADLAKAIEQEMPSIKFTVKKPIFKFDQKQAHLLQYKNSKQSFDIDGQVFELEIYQDSFYLIKDSVNKKFGDKASIICQIIQAFKADEVTDTIQKNGGVFKCKLDNQEYQLKLKEDLVLSWFDI